MRLTRSAVVEGRDGRPFTSSLLSCLVKNFGYEGLTIVIFETEDIRSNIDEEGVKDAFVPFIKNGRDFVLTRTQTALQNIVRFRNQLHITVFNACEAGLAEGA